MDQIRSSCYSKITWQSVILLIAVMFTACRPEGFINKVKYRGENYINTCESFSKEINKLIQRNSDASLLRVSEYDNSDFTYYYLEQGQFEIWNDTLRFRLIQDLPYPHYLDKGIAVHVIAGYKAVDRIKELEKEPSGVLGTLVVDQAYYLANRKPFFIYKIPLNGRSLEGKQLTLSFAIAKYDKNGILKDFYCNTESQPVGTAFPPCCSASPWESSNLKSVVDFPEIEVDDEVFLYKGFTGTIDVQFQENSFDLKDDSTFTALTIQAFVNKYKNLGYKVTKIDLMGYASPGGKESLNLKLSQARADALKNSLEVLNSESEDLEILANGMGEDWERVKLLTQRSSLPDDAKDRTLAIVNDTKLTNDQKEAKLRRVPFWDVLVEEVLVKARHTFAILDFDYAGEHTTLERYAEELPVASRELEEIANTKFTVSPFSEGANIDQEMKTINNILTQKATPNLYAMRATYQLAQKEYDSAIDDLEKAGRFRGPNQQNYQLAVQGYKVFFSDEYNFDRRKELYEEYNDLAQRNPNDQKIFFNRAILMDKIGYISGALGEYESLLNGQSPTSIQFNNRGVARLKTLMLSEATEDFEAAIRLDPGMAEVYFNLAAICAYRGYTLRAVENLDKAIAIDPTYKAKIFESKVFEIMSEDPRFDKYR